MGFNNFCITFYFNFVLGYGIKIQIETEITPTQIDVPELAEEGADSYTAEPSNLNRK